jgi:hypothetical protein
MMELMEAPLKFHQPNAMEYDVHNLSARNEGIGTGSRAYRSKRDISSIIDSNNIDMEDSHLHKRILVDLQALTLHSSSNNKSTNEINDHNSLDSQQTNSPQRDMDYLETDDIDHLVTSPFFSSHKRYLNKADELFEKIIRKSRRMTENISYNNSMNIDDGIVPASIGPHPATDMQIGLYWPTSESQLALILPNISQTIGRPYLPNRRSNRPLKTIDEDEEDDASDATLAWPAKKTMSAYQEIPRLSGDQTHAGVIEVVSELSSLSDESMSQITMEASDDMDLSEDHRMQENQSCVSSLSDDEDDVIDILTVN